MRQTVVAIKALTVLALVAFVGATLARHLDELRSYHFVVSVTYLVASLVAGVLIYWLYGHIWYVITAKLGISIPYVPSLRIWMTSLCGKYIPGKVWMYMGRVYLYRQFSRPASTVSLAVVIEGASSFASSLVVVLVSLWLIDVPLPSFLWPATIAMLCVVLVVFHPWVLERVVNVALTVLRRDTVRIEVRYVDMLGILVMSLVAAIAKGVMLWLIVNSLIPLSLDTIGYLTAASSLSSVVGMMAVFAPAGLGVQEAVIIVILQSIMPVYVATMMSVLLRVVMTVVELALVSAFNGGHLLPARVKSE